MSEMRQRWRLTVRRGPDARDTAHPEVAAGWEAALRASGLPVAETQAARPRPRIVFAAPAPVGMLGERELIDLGLTECRLVHDVRQAVTDAAPAGYSLVDIHDVWTGAPTLPSLVVAADYRADAAAVPAGADPAAAGERAAGERAAGATSTSDEELDAAIAALLASPRIEIQRDKGSGVIGVDIRPLVMRLRRVASPGDGSFGLQMRLRLGGAGGVGRPEEIVSTLAQRLGRPIRMDELVRERIHLADDPPETDPEG